MFIILQFTFIQQFTKYIHITGICTHFTLNCIYMRHLIMRDKAATTPLHNFKWETIFNTIFSTRSTVHVMMGCIPCMFIWNNAC